MKHMDPLLRDTGRGEDDSLQSKPLVLSITQKLHGDMWNGKKERKGKWRLLLVV